MKRSSDTVNGHLHRTKAIGALVIILVTILTLHTTTWSATEYETSVYAVISPYFWIIAALSFLAGSYLILKNDFEYGFDTLLGIFIIIQSNILILFVPLFRGYLSWSIGDPLFHLGEIRGVLSSGSLNLFENGYPVLRTLAAVLVKITGIDPNSLTLFLPQLFLLFLSLLIFLSIRLFISEKLILSFAFVFAFIPALKLTILDPGRLVLVTFTLSYFVYLRFKRTRSQRYSIVLILLLTSIILYHPVTATILFLLLSLHMIVDRYTGQTPIMINTGETIITIGVLIHIYWIIQHDRAVQLLLGSIDILSGSSSDAATYGSLLARASPSIETLSQLVIFRYGNTIVIGIVVGCIFLLYIGNIGIRRNDLRGEYTSILATFILLSGLAVISLFTFYFGPFRIFPLIKIVGILIIMISVNRLSFNRKSIRLFLYVLLTIIFVISIIGVYPSPEFTKEQNRQLTEENIKSASWIYSNIEDSRDNISHVGTPLRRLNGYIHRGDSVPIRERTPPQHFEYPSKEGTDLLLISERGKEFYPTVYPEFRHAWSFSPTDFERLNYRTDTIKIYSSGNVESYLINHSSHEKESNQSD